MPWYHLMLNRHGAAQSSSELLRQLQAVSPTTSPSKSVGQSSVRTLKTQTTTPDSIAHGAYYNKRSSFWKDVKVATFVLEKAQSSNMSHQDSQTHAVSSCSLFPPSSTFFLLCYAMKRSAASKEPKMRNADGKIHLMSQWVITCGQRQHSWQKTKLKSFVTARGSTESHRTVTHTSRMNPMASTL